MDVGFHQYDLSVVLRTMSIQSIVNIHLKHHILRSQIFFGKCPKLRTIQKDQEHVAAKETKIEIEIFAAQHLVHCPISMELSQLLLLMKHPRYV